MKTTYKIAAIFLCLVMILISLVSCKMPKPTVAPDTSEEISDTEEIQETAEQTTEVTPEPEIPYIWVKEPGVLQGDIQPFFDIMSNTLVSLGVHLFNNNGSYHIIDSDGNIKCNLNADDFNYCSACGSINNHMYRIDPQTYTSIEYPGGHGGPNTTPIVYDIDTGKMFNSYIGYYEPVDYEVKYAIVSICNRQPLEEGEMSFSGLDYTYENSEGYGLVINGELKLRGFEMYSKYKDGVVSLCRDGKWGYYDTEGNEILPHEYSPSAMKSFNYLYEQVNIPYQPTYGIIALCRNGKWGYADIKGNMLTDFEFEEARPVYKNKGWVKTAEGWGVIELDYIYPEKTDEEIRQSLNNTYMAISVDYKQIGTIVQYDTNFRIYTGTGEYNYYVTDDGTCIDISIH